ncbi:26S proteasome non-ATPase regulatory subunit 2-like isoform X2 [Teleopsis dalmanni]|uniref:26S proteasome non-ATPase regulatory subunit 2-like isoform X2 n=1 Tax=Teleopsis dalmanni TaxID=139649 RepID=UPI0018CEB48B|nr:26S proteasome non-ATPase regulatory subunit 2-like isoform X2 [Teleopsis dalmanni]
MSWQEEKAVETLAIHTNKGDVEMENCSMELEKDEMLLQHELESIIIALKNPLNISYKQLLERLAYYIRASTVTMTSVPKPLKYLAPHYETMKAVFELIIDQDSRELFAEILSVLSITSKREQDCLLYRLKCNANSRITDWGHEYVRHLSFQITHGYFQTPSVKRLQLIELVKQIVVHNLKHNAEIETCDLLMEIDHLHLLHDYVDSSSFPRVALYLQSCHSYVTEPEKKLALNTLYKLTRKFKNASQSMFCAFLLNDIDKVKEVFNETKDYTERQQLALMLARQQICLDLDLEESDNEALVEIMSNGNYSRYFLSFAHELDIMEPKTPDNIYKTNLESTRTLLQVRKIDSAKQNLAASFVNGFVNTGFCVEKLLSEDGNKWIYRNKDHAMLSATASYGLVYLWDIEGGLTMLDKYMYCEQVYIKAGALLGCGIVNCGINSEVDAAHALLSEHVASKEQPIKVSAIFGLGLAYAGSNRNLVIKTLKSVFENMMEPCMEVLGITALSLGLVSVGSCNVELTELLYRIISNLPIREAENSFSRFLWLALGLIYLGKQKSADALIQRLEKLQQPFKSLTTTTVEICAYAGTGNLLKIQKLLHICLEHYPSKHKSCKEKIAKQPTDNKDERVEHDARKVKTKHRRHDKDKKQSKKNDVLIDMTINVLYMENKNNAENDTEELQGSKEKIIKKTEACTQTDNVAVIKENEDVVEFRLEDNSGRKIEVSTQTDTVMKVNASTDMEKFEENVKENAQLVTECTENKKALLSVLVNNQGVQTMPQTKDVNKFQTKLDEKIKKVYEKKKIEMEDKIHKTIEEKKKLKQKHEAKKLNQIRTDLSSSQSITVVGIALIAMGEDIGIEMSTRMFGILLRYCEPCVRRAVPLAIGLLYASNPKMIILEMLSKYSHDSDTDVAQSAIFAMGLICAGTNNARNAAMLRQLAQYYAKVPSTLFMVRIAQGLNHLGKGTLTLSPYHSDRQIMNPMAVAGLLTILFSLLDTKNLIMGHSHYLLYALVPAIQSRMLMTFDENMNQLQVSVRVGIAVDTVGQAGNPKLITGFQTQTTPILLSMGERAELTTDEYISLSAVLEGFVILRKNPSYMDI